MHLRKSTKRRGDKLYVYHQLVESFRRPDGVPSHRVLASLGHLSPIEEINVKRALQASREGVEVILPSTVAAHVAPGDIQANLRYLDLAVVLRTWEDWQLGEIIDDLVGSTRDEVPPSQIVAALVAQRCVAPASKLKAQSWYPTTALPELQAVPPRKFTNTRIHRVLEQLESIERPLQQRLARRIHGRHGVFSLFLDITDTWFEGRGPPIARRRKTKEGMLRSLIGIVLLCDERGLPLRWVTVPGTYDEARTMSEMARRISKLSWARQVPLVADRAMGRGMTVGILHGLGLHFVTAVPSHEMPSYTDEGATAPFEAVKIRAAEASATQDIAALGEAAAEAGFEQVRDDRFVRDLGLIEREVPEPTDEYAAIGISSRSPSRAVAALRVAYRARDDLQAGTATDLDGLVKLYGCSQPTLRRWRSLLKLSVEIQKRILAGEADRMGLPPLQHIAQLPRHQQHTAMDEACQQARGKAVQSPTRALKRLAGAPPIAVRAVLCFHPNRFREKRLDERDKLRKLEAFVIELNRRLRSPSSNRNQQSVVAEVAVRLKRDKWFGLFEIDVRAVQHQGRAVFRAKLHRDESAWMRRRQADGLSLIIAHPQIQGSAEEIVALYFAKDKVEKDFQTIKDVLELRPVRHRTETKIRAHVTLCLLALLIERTVEQRLKDAGETISAASAIEKLATCHLNIIRAKHDTKYTLTRTDTAQKRILDLLNMEKLVDDSVTKLTPR